MDPTRQTMRRILTEAEAPQATYYHGTSKRIVNEILEHGLDPAWSGTESELSHGGIYFYAQPDPVYALVHLRKADTVILEVDLGGLDVHVDEDVMLDLLSRSSPEDFAEWATSRGVPERVMADAADLVREYWESPDKYAPGEAYQAGVDLVGMLDPHIKPEAGEPVRVFTSVEPSRLKVFE